MISILGWLVYAIVVGLIAKAIHPGDDPIGLGWTIGLGVVGSYLGGFLNWLIWGGISPLSSSGIIMGIVGAVVFLMIYRYYRLNFVAVEQRSFWTGKKHGK